MSPLGITLCAVAFWFACGLACWLGIRWANKD
jgi:hypothetical protein